MGTFMEVSFDRFLKRGRKRGPTRIFLVHLKAQRDLRRWESTYTHLCSGHNEGEGTLVGANAGKKNQGSLKANVGSLEFNMHLENT